MKDDESIPVSTPTTAYSSLNTNSIHSKSLYDATLFGRGTVSLRWSAGNLNSLSDLFDIPKSDDLDVLEMEDREKLVNHMWDVYTNSPRIRLLKFWQEAFEAAYEELNSDVAEVREAAISEISKMSIRFVHIDLPPLRSMCCERRSPRHQWQEARRGDPSSPFAFVARQSSKGDAMTTKGERKEARKASPFVFS
uniref:Sugar transporter n=1 Tax=Solanum tuberosum TaxID=4113 RepID=M1BIB1_SOLTU